MYLRYFAILGVFAINNVNSYSAHRYPRLTTTKHANPDPKEIVIPARYKIKGKPYDDPTIGENIHNDNPFPEVEYPSSIIDSSKPFYVNLSPFSDDVKSSFKSLVSAKPSKPTPTIIVNVKHRENRQENSNAKSTTSQKSDAAITKEKENNSSDKSKDETVQIKALALDKDDDSGHQITQQKPDKVPSTISPEECDSEEFDDVIENIDNLDDFLSALTAIETEMTDSSNNCTANTFDSSHPKEFVTITSDVTSVNNGSVAELNEGSLHTKPDPSNDESKDSSSMRAPVTNEDVTLTSFSNEMQGDSGGIGKIANDNNSFGIEQ